MTSNVEPSALPSARHKAPSRRSGVLRFQHQVNAIDELIHDHDPLAAETASGDAEDVYEGLSVEIMRVLRDAETAGADMLEAVRALVPRASHELLTRIVQAWDEN